jgi:hypothetical protein
MNKKIYILKNRKQLAGPYSLEVLKEKQLTGSELIWFEGLPDWTQAKLVDSIREAANFSDKLRTKSKLKEKMGWLI